MRVSELGRRSEVSAASIKYSLREGLLTAGVQTAGNQAVYGDQHVRRLRLIRSLIDIGGLSISHVRATLRRFYFPTTLTDFDSAADTAERTAAAEVKYARSMPDRTNAVETMLVGTVVLERALVEVRRLALEAASFRIDGNARAVTPTEPS
ncbi:MerR family transcriptional regulator [Rhodococcus sp. PAMC28707]|uniref:MerR family transcriptional regulator n=1 Tax=unclassified Rhodococcus (in: high G+C Gram-positive bacteria) TaxID=192944 RepID=UPI00109DA09F|nr:MULTISPECIES: MerR family transcriptional regulator [unclassified Rhodococcus (in: high G+C Gram-positive bacteria)]QCB50638.1 MerR family transcriptional regulator [Rhodococcus sp. PAMC28705]QCB57670.1 MerR family transcriptional regulator [Rhodococcus sp. PAMC28707]